MRFDRSSGWEEEGGEASGSEVSQGKEQSPWGVPLPPGWVEDGDGNQFNFLYSLPLEESFLLSPGMQFWSRSPFLSIQGCFQT